MRNCSELKRLNSDKKFRSELNEILNLCRQNGHRPVRGTDMFRRLTSIEHAMYIRTIKNTFVPSDIMTLISDIKSLPSLAEKQRSEVIKQAVPKNRLPNLLLSFLLLIPLRIINTVNIHPR